MATLNWAFKEISCKIVYYGCGLCGKTTNLQHVHKTVPGKFRGDLVSLATEQDRTLFFDFLPLDLGEVKGFKTKFQLYTVPGQVYYNATRKLVLRGVDGIVFVADSQKDRLQENMESFENLRQNLAEYSYHLQMTKEDEEGIPWVLQLNKRDMPQISTREELIAALGGSTASPTVDAVAVTGQGVKETLKAISSLVIQKLNTGSGALAGGGATASAKPPAPGSAPAKPAAPAKPVAEFDDRSMKEDEEPNEEEVPKAVAKKASDSKAAKPTLGQPPVAAAKPPEPKAEQKPAPKPEAPKAPAKPAPPPPPPKPVTITVTQVCDAHWRGFFKGTGSLTLAPVGDSTEQYQLTGTLAFLFGKRVFAKTLVKASGKDARMFDGQQAEFHVFEGAAGADGPAVKVLVQDNTNKSMYFSYLGTGGEVRVYPAGTKKMP